MWSFDTFFTTRGQLGPTEVDWAGAHAGSASTAHGSSASSQASPGRGPLPLTPVHRRSPAVTSLELIQASGSSHPSRERDCPYSSGDTWSVTQQSACLLSIQDEKLGRVLSLRMLLRRTVCRKSEQGLGTCPFHDSLEPSSVRSCPQGTPGPGGLSPQQAPSLPCPSPTPSKLRPSSAHAALRLLSGLPADPCGLGSGEKQRLPLCGPHALLSAGEPGRVQPDLFFSLPISGPSLSPEPTVQAEQGPWSSGPSCTRCYG